MKKLPFCMLLSSGAFAVAGTVLLTQIAPQPDPFPLFFPLLWDLVMVGAAVGIVLRCDCARCAGMIWGVFCILASIAIGAAAFFWLLPQQGDPMGTERLVFMLVTVAFGLLFGVWQLFAVNSPAVRNWAEHTHHPDTPTQPHHS
jgi:hypothetical protein